MYIANSLNIIFYHVISHISGENFFIGDIKSMTLLVSIIFIVIGQSKDIRISL
jgi:hypothetical protein